MGFTKGLNGADLGKGAGAATGENDADTVTGHDTSNARGITDIALMHMEPARWLDDIEPRFRAAGGMRLGDAFGIEQDEVRRTMEQGLLPGAGRGIGLLAGVSQQEDVIDLS